jgi:hypothetical protein
MTPLERIVKRINRNGDVNHAMTPRPLLSLEEFFEGNDSYASIGYNFYPDQPSPAEFYEFFKDIRNKPTVGDVVVEISQQEVPEEWPSTETVWIIISASPEDVSGWLGERFRADEIFDGWISGNVREPYVLPGGMKPIGVWWD